MHNLKKSFSFKKITFKILKLEKTWSTFNKRRWKWAEIYEYRYNLSRFHEKGKN